MTQENDHIRALKTGAEMLSHRGLLQKLELLEELYELEGSLPAGLSNYKDSLYQELMRFAKQQMNEKEYNAFYNAY
jgi:hypothetical protein